MTNNPSGIELSWYSKGYNDGIKEANKQTTQVPMAFIKQGGSGYPVLVFNRRFEYESITAKQPDIPLYTHPKQWQSLSREEFVAIAKSIWGDNLGMGDGYGSSVAWASSYATIEPSSKMLLLLQEIDKALKEKNT